MYDAAPIPLDPTALEGLADYLASALAERMEHAKGQGGLAMERVWTFQRTDEVRRVGKEQASHYVGWRDPHDRRRHKSCGPGPAGLKKAQLLKRRLDAELATGHYEERSRATWAALRREYEELELAGKDDDTACQAKNAMDHFERLVKPRRVAALRTTDVDRYKTKRLREDSPFGGKIAPATVNKELRHLRAVLRKARKWKYLSEVPEFDFLREPKRLREYVPPEHFAALYAACDQATLPDCRGHAPADWWRALLVLLYLTGWRIEQARALRRGDVNLETGVIYSDADDNKGKRDVKLVLPPAAVEHLTRLPGFTPTFFPFPHRRMALWDEFKRLQAAAKVKPDRKDWYGFHDLRRGFATMNADRLTPDALQASMQHRDYQTTQGYIILARQLRPAAQAVYVPDVLKSVPEPPPEPMGKQAG